MVDLVKQVKIIIKKIQEMMLLHEVDKPGSDVDDYVS